MKRDEKGERKFAGLTLEEHGELLKMVTKEFKWALSREEYLRKRYPNRFIAVKDKRVIANSSNREVVIAELKKKNIDPMTVYIQFLPKERPKYLLHC